MSTAVNQMGNQTHKCAFDSSLFSLNALQICFCDTIIILITHSTVQKLSTCQESNSYHELDEISKAQYAKSMYPHWFDNEESGD